MHILGLTPKPLFPPSFFPGRSFVSKKCRTKQLLAGYSGTVTVLNPFFSVCILLLYVYTLILVYEGGASNDISSPLGGGGASPRAHSQGCTALRCASRTDPNVQT